MDGRLIFELLIGGGLLWLIVSFHWARILACLVLLVAWGLFAIVAPAYFALSRLAEGAVFSAILTLGLGAVLGFFWWIAAKGAYEWAERRKRFGDLWLPWNAR